MQNLTMKIKNYTDFLKDAHGRCGGKERIPFGQSRELLGHAVEILAQNPDALKLALRIGKRRLAKKRRSK